MKLGKSDWDTLDTLLGKIGFGGYYDLVEVLKSVIENLEPKLDNKLTNESDLHMLIMLLVELSKKEGGG